MGVAVHLFVGVVVPLFVFVRVVVPLFVGVVVPLFVGVAVPLLWWLLWASKEIFQVANESLESMHSHRLFSTTAH